MATAPTQAHSAGEARSPGGGGAAAAAAVAAGNGGPRPASTPAVEPRGGSAGQEGQPGDQEEDEDEDVAQKPEPEQLRRKWAEEVAVVKHLARQGLPEGHPALVAAVAARDAAEAAWRGAKPPAPIATRLRWAQAKLSRALELAHATQEAIGKAEADHERLMRELHDRRCDDEARVRKRRQAVEELQGEIGGGQKATRTGGGGAAEVLAACGSLCNAVGPELLALVERLPDGSDEWHAANKALATLAASQRRVEEAAGLHDDHGCPEAFDIGDAEGDGSDAMSETSQWSESHELRDQRATGVASAAADQAFHHGGAASGAVGEDVAQGGENWASWEQAQWQSAHWQTDQHGRWRRASWADQWEAEHVHAAPSWGPGQQSSTSQCARRGGGERDEDAGEPSAKHRRQQGSERAAEMGGAAPTVAGSEAATGAREANQNASTGPSPTAPGGAASFARQVDDVVKRAISLGIQPVTSEGEELITLSPELLSRWVADHLDRHHQAGDGR